ARRRGAASHARGAAPAHCPCRCSSSSTLACCARSWCVHARTFARRRGGREGVEPFEGGTERGEEAAPELTDVVRLAVARAETAQQVEARSIEPLLEVGCLGPA